MKHEGIAVARHPGTALMIGMVALASLTSCGGSGDSDQASGKDNEFCSELRRLENEPDTSDPAAALEALAGLADKAPNDKVRDALESLAPIIEQLSSADVTDEEAFGTFLGLAFSPEFQKAGKVLEEYSVEVCGFEPSDSESTDSTDGGNGDNGSGAGSTGAIFDDLEASDIGDAVNEYLDAESPDTEYRGVSMSAAGDATLVEIFLEGAEPDAVRVCEVVVDFIDEESGDPAVEIAIKHLEIVVAERKPGGDCAAV